MDLDTLARQIQSEIASTDEKRARLRGALVALTMAAQQKAVIQRKKITRRPHGANLPVILAAFAQGPATSAEIAKRCPEIPAGSVQTTLAQLRKSGRVIWQDGENGDGGYVLAPEADAVAGESL